MTYRPRANCKWCNRGRYECGGLSRSGACEECGNQRMIDAIYQMSDKKGPMWNKRTEGYMQYVIGLWGDTLGDTPAEVLQAAESCVPTDSGPS